MANPVPPRLKLRYREQIVPQLQSERGFTNRMQVPRLDKIGINMGAVTTALLPARQALHDLADVAPAPRQVRVTDRR